jgi:hypothetical protein
LNGPLVMGLEYDIISITTPGYPKPQVRARRNSVDLETAPPPEANPPALAERWVAAPLPVPRTLSKTEAEGRIPPQYRAQVIYQAQEAPEKERRGWFTGEDTEDSLEQRARNILGILGSWRRFAFWRSRRNSDGHDQQEEGNSAQIYDGT